MSYVQTTYSKYMAMLTAKHLNFKQSVDHYKFPMRSFRGLRTVYRDSDPCEELCLSTSYS